MILFVDGNEIFVFKDIDVIDFKEIGSEWCYICWKKLVKIKYGKKSKKKEVDDYYDFVVIDGVINLDIYRDVYIWVL